MTESNARELLDGLEEVAKLELEDTGSIWALIMHLFPAYDLERVQLLTEDELLWFAQHIPMIEARRAYPMAKLEASVKNGLGGKAKSGGKTLARGRAFSGFELLPFYASFDFRLTSSEVAKLQMKAELKFIPSWAIELLDDDVLTD